VYQVGLVARQSGDFEFVVSSSSVGFCNFFLEAVNGGMQFFFLFLVLPLLSQVGTAVLVVRDEGVPTGFGGPLFFGYCLVALGDGGEYLTSQSYPLGIVLEFCGLDLFPDANVVAVELGVGLLRSR
jgi:hypothetical protein